MHIRFGNLTVRQFADSVGADFADEQIEQLEAYRTDEAMFTDESKFHIFEDPAISVVLGDVAFDETFELFRAANERQSFTREVSFHIMDAQT